MNMPVQKIRDFWFAAVVEGNAFLERVFWEELRRMRH